VLPLQQPAPRQATQTQEQTVFITKTGKKYHRGSCRYLSRSKIPVALKDAKANGFTRPAVFAGLLNELILLPPNRRDNKVVGRRRTPPRGQHLLQERSGPSNRGQARSLPATVTGWTAGQC
jgi:hypothetical protein